MNIEYNKEGILILKDNISLIDKSDNNLETNFIQYNEQINFIY